MRFRHVLVLASALAFGALSAADLTITFNVTTKGKASTEIRYFTSGFMKTQNDKEQRDTLTDFKQGVLYLVDHKKKTISTISFDDAAAAMDKVGVDTGASGMMGSVMGAMFGDPNDCKVTPQPAETVAGRTCEVWNIKVGKLTMLVDADPSLRMPVPDASFTRMMQASAAQFAKLGPTGACYKRLYEEMARIKGIHLKTHQTATMGVDITTEATAIASGPIPASTFVLPAGYTTEDLGKKLLSSNRKN
jgi:hypothetical protein